MNASNIVNQFLSSVTNNMHKTRRNAVSSCVQSLLSGAASSVTAIGRGINSTAKEKHNIKRADRLCSNVILQSELLNIYGGIVRRFVTSNRPLIHVDWSDLDVSKRNFLIRASVALDGRSITIYQEVHSIRTKEKPTSHLAFLTKLKVLLSAECKPIIVTDAGFKTPWFRQVWGGIMLGEPESLIFMLLMGVKIGNALPNCISQQAKRLKLLMVVLHDIAHWNAD